MRIRVQLVAHAAEECGNAFRITLFFFYAVIPEADEVDDAADVEGCDERAPEGVGKEFLQLGEDGLAHFMVGCFRQAGIVDEEGAVRGDGERVILDARVETIPAGV